MSYTKMLSDAMSDKPVTAETELGHLCQAPVERAPDGNLYVLLGGDWFLIDLNKMKDDNEQARCLWHIEHNSRPGIKGPD